MSCYVSSNDNRFYVQTEATYGKVPEVSELNRFPAVKLAARQIVEQPQRRDKTGSRTFAGAPAGSKRRTNFELSTYLTSWTIPGQEPGYGPLLRAAMGADPWIFNGGTVASVVNGTRVRITASHGLRSGQAVTADGEMRFVAAIVDAQTVELNAPFTQPVVSGSSLGSTITYPLGSDLPSVSLFDYWSPVTAVQRLLCGAAVGSMELDVNGDFHEFRFKGPAADLLDSCSFLDGQGGLAAFPVEPEIDGLAHSVVPGHLGQAWLGTVPEQFFNLTEAKLKLDNGVETRHREFGSDRPRCITAGQRNVSLDLSLYSKDNSATRDLYEAARHESPITIMLQLGQQPGQLFGSYLRSVVPTIPEYDDSETRLQWHFVECRAQGIADDELVVALG